MAALNYIYIGSVSDPSFYFDNESLLSLNVNVSSAVLEDELKIDTLEFSVNYDDADELLRNIPYATPIYYYAGSNIVGTFFFKSIRRFGTNYYDISAVSLVGLLDYETFYGGMYVNQNVKDVVGSILLTDGINPNNAFVQVESIRTKPELTSFNSVALTDDLTAHTLNQNTSMKIVFSILGISETSTSAEDVFKFEVQNTSGGDRYGFTIMVGEYSGQYYAEVQCGINAANEFMFTYDLGDEITIWYLPNFGAAMYKINDGDYQFVRLNANSSSETFYFAPFVGRASKSYNSDFNVYKLFSDAQFQIKEITWADVDINIFSHPSITEGDDIIFLDGVEVLSCIKPFYNVLNNNSCFVDLISGYIATATDYQVDDEYVASVSEIEGRVPLGYVSTTHYYGQYDFTWDTSFVVSNYIYQLNDRIIWNDGAELLNMSGWIPICSKREALHRILFAMNLNLLKSEDGGIIIGKLVSEVAGDISDDNIYNIGSVEDVKKPLHILLTEYSYNATASVVEVFNNVEESVDPDITYIIEFKNAPIYGTPTTSGGIEIESYNANAAFVKGTGIITSRVYQQNRKVISKTIGDRLDGGDVSVTNDTLITMLNSNNVMKKMLAYYNSNAKTIKNSILANGEKCGNKYRFKTPFEDLVTAYLSSYNLAPSAVTKLNCQFVSGFEPVDIGNTYNSFVILTGIGTWTVPDEVFNKESPRIYVVLIGGGNGGASGLAGEDGESIGKYFNTATQARGGMYGANGANGKVFTQEIINPESSYEYSCGAGGAGADYCSDTRVYNVGSDGENTTFGTYSSASGKSSEIGYTNILNGDVYAGNMPKWNESSGKGGDGNAFTIDNQKNVTPEYASSVYNIMTGFSAPSRTSGFDYWGTTGTGAKAIQYVSGGFGGHSYDVTGAWPDRVYSYHYKQYFYMIGGNGANAVYKPPKANVYNPTYFGYGGMGGCGGGGGGCGGAYEDRLDPVEDKVYAYSGGVGGVGGRGGDGGDGCVVIYY